MLQSCPFVDEAVELAAEHLREFPVVPKGTASDVVNDGDLADFWVRLQRICVERGVEQIDVVREENGDEFYHYEYEGSVMEILYSDIGVNLFMAGR